MCNLYSITTNQEAIRHLFRVMNRYLSNLPRCRACFRIIPPLSSQRRPERELVLMRWGMPPPPRTADAVTNIRNTSSPHWRGSGPCHSVNLWRMPYSDWL
jgi:putative SOS response-associated peptidase YedK